VVERGRIEIGAELAIDDAEHVAIELRRDARGVVVRTSRRA
jgi:hypothetical protein